MNLPNDFKIQMQSLLGDEYTDFFNSYKQENHYSLRVNTLKGKTDDFLHQSGFDLEPVLWCDSGFYYQNSQRPGKSSLHHAGAFYIQEASAMAVVEAAEIQKGDKVLDLCAAPGGKSTHIACKLEGSGILISNEIVPQRAKILSQNIERMGIKNAVVTNENPKKLEKAFPSFFDKIIVDAPCSGEGMFRKDPACIEQWSLEQTEVCADRQKLILESAHKMLAEGGILVYSTCTFSPLENEMTISAFLEDHKEYSLIKPCVHKYFTPGYTDFPSSEITESYKKEPNQALPQEENFTDKYSLQPPQQRSYSKFGFSGVKLRQDINRTMRLFPHKIKGEGHFIAVLQKGETSEKSKKINYIKTVSDKKLLKPFFEFQDKFLNISFGNFVLFGDNLYSIPQNTPNLDGVKVLRAGLHLGQIIKNRFEPSHALAMALKPPQAKQYLSLPSDSEEIISYLKGNVLENKNDFKSWCLVCSGEYSTGWVKAVDNQLKNHYPKGLRILSV